MNKSKKIFAYIDGFNFYHGLIKFISNNNDLDFKHKSIDVRKLIKHFLNKNEVLEKVYYFTAPPNHLAIDKQNRHRSYCDDLKDYCDVEVVQGEFSKKDKAIKCSTCKVKNTFSTHEEKKTDVYLTLNIINDVLVSDVDKIILVSADTDFLPIVEYILDKTNKEILVLLPPCSSNSKRRTNYISNNPNTRYNETIIKKTYHIKTSKITNPNKKYNPK